MTTKAERAAARIRNTAGRAATGVRETAARAAEVGTEVEHRVCPINGRAMIECPQCGADNAAQADFGQPGVMAVVCGTCKGILHFAVSVIRPPDPAVIKEAGAYSTELALCGSGKNGKARAAEIGAEHPHDPQTGRQGRRKT